MDWGATNSYGESQQITCDCGVTLEVRYAKQDGHNEVEEFSCPECGRKHSAMASMSIRENQVKVID